MAKTAAIFLHVGLKHLCSCDNIINENKLE